MIWTWFVRLIRPARVDPETDPFHRRMDAARSFGQDQTAAARAELERIRHEHDILSISERVRAVDRMGGRNGDA